jgi:pyruvate/2-oxoglutarate dehydrogenase complex dihydrolipoamide acyltransferase (E2) component
MRVSIVWKAGSVLAAVLALSLIATNAARAQQPIMITMAVTENREPGLMGMATITPLPNSQVRVDIRITGLPPNDTARPAHIHTAQGARCDSGAPVTYPLENVSVDAMGVGTSSTVVTLTADKPVTANNAYVNVHNPAQMGRGVICGNITVTLAGATAAAPATQPGAPRPAAAPAQPAAQRPAAAPARPAAAPAQRPAAAPARPAAAPAQRPAAVPRTGTGLQADSSFAWSLAGLAAIALLLAGSGALAMARRR